MFKYLNPGYAELFDDVNLQASSKDQNSTPWVYLGDSAGFNKVSLDNGNEYWVQYDIDVSAGLSTSANLLRAYTRLGFIALGTDSVNANRLFFYVSETADDVASALTKMDSQYFDIPAGISRLRVHIKSAVSSGCIELFADEQQVISFTDITVLRGEPMRYVRFYDGNNSPTKDTYVRNIIISDRKPSWKEEVIVVPAVVTGNWEKSADGKTYTTSEVGRTMILEPDMSQYKEFTPISMALWGKNAITGVNVDGVEVDTGNETKQTISLPSTQGTVHSCAGNRLTVTSVKTGE